MSHYAEIETQYMHEKELVQALEDIFGKGNVERYLNPHHLYGYMGDQRDQTAHIIVRRNHVGPAANDLGFVRDGDNYRMIISDYDRGQSGRHVDRLPALYAERVIRNRINRQGMRLKSSTQTDEGTKLVLQVYRR